MTIAKYILPKMRQQLTMTKTPIKMIESSRVYRVMTKLSSSAVLTHLKSDDRESETKERKMKRTVT